VFLIDRRTGIFKLFEVLTDIDDIIGVKFKHAWLSLEKDQRTTRRDSPIISRSHLAALPQTSQSAR
jgi:hypothetical protein